MQVENPQAAPEYPHAVAMVIPRQLTSLVLQLQVGYPTGLCAPDWKELCQLTLS